MEFIDETTDLEIGRKDKMISFLLKMVFALILTNLFALGYIGYLVLF